MAEKNIEFKLQVLDSVLQSTFQDKFIFVIKFWLHKGINNFPKFISLKITVTNIFR